MNYEFEAQIDTNKAAQVLRIHPKALQQMTHAGRVFGSLGANFENVDSLNR